MSSTFLAFSFRHGKFEINRLHRVAEIVSRYVPSVYNRIPQIVLQDKFGAIVWTKKGGDASSGVIQHAGYTLVVAGGLPSRKVAETIIKQFAYAPNTSFEGSHGGTASLVVGHGTSGRITGWTTMPSVVPLFVSEVNAEYAVLGSRPLLVHLAAQAGKSVSMRRDYLQEMLPSGYSLGGNTAFDGVKRIALQDAIHVDDTGIRAIPHLIPTEGLQERSIEVAAAKYGDILREVVSCHPVQPRVFRLSGGKDSRLVAAALAGFADVRAVTDGDPCEGEAIIAAQVARSCGFEHQIRPVTDYSRPLVDAADYFNLITEGLTSHDPIKYAEVLTSDVETELVTGQGELHKGGYARVSGGGRDPLGLLQARLFDRRLLSGTAYGNAQALLRKWFQERESIFKEEKAALYWAYVDFRLGHWYMNRYTQWDGRHHLHMPLLDDRVSRFLATVPLSQKIQEDLLFETVKYLKRSLTNIPLYEDDWLSPRARRFIPNIRPRLREKTVRQANNPAKSNLKPKGPTPRHVAADYILSSSARKDVQDAVSKDMWDQLQSFALKRGPTEFWKDETINKKRKDSFLFRIFMITALYERDWLKPYI